MKAQTTLFCTTTTITTFDNAYLTMGMWDGEISPSFKDDRIGWNRAYENDLAKFYGADRIITMKRGRHDMPDLLSGPAQFVTDDLAQNISSLKKQVCILQRDLSQKVSQRYAEDDFVEHWSQKCTDSDRRKWILEGLVRTCEASPDFEGNRKWAPETTLTRLLFQSGRGFLTLMESLIVPDFEKAPTDFRTVPNAIFDAMNKNEQKNKLDKKTQLLQLSHNISRTYFLTMFCWNTLLAFYGESETYGLTTTGKSNKKILKETISESGDPTLRDAYRTARKGERTNKALGATPHCTSCDLPADRAGVVSLQACQRCKAIGRSVYYCSKACQVNDWKKGSPPHKSLCGKAEAFLDSLTTKPQESEQKTQSSKAIEWGNVRKGFVRSPALVHQLKFLEEHNHQFDYVAIRPYPEPDQGIIMQNALARMMFQAMFHRAICRPAPLEILKIYELLESSAAEIQGYGRAGMKKQLKKEFGYDIDELKKTRDTRDLSPITLDEIQRVKDDIKKYHLK